MSFSFESKRLRQELLALGNPKITTSLADQISQEVEQDLQGRPSTRINAELISGMVAFKLKELGILKSNSKQKSPETKPSVEKKPEVTLPTLEKFISSPQLKTPPAPPRTQVQVDPQGLQTWENLSQTKDSKEKGSSQLRHTYLKVAQQAAQAKAFAQASLNQETLAVEFFNVMANQEFYPHVSELVGKQNWQASSTGFVWIDLLNLSLAAQEQVLVDTKKLWQQGTRVGFLLSYAQQKSAFHQVSLKQFLQDLARMLEELPMSLALPHPVSFYLWGHHEETLDLLKTLFGESGMSYLFPELQVFVGWSSQENLDSLKILQTLQQDCQQEDWPIHWWEEKSTASKTDESHAFLNTILDDLQLPHPGGGAFLRPYETCQMGSLNLSVCASGGEVDFSKLRRIIRTAVRFLDHLVETNTTALEKVSHRSQRRRKIALGVMGWAEMLAKLGCPYDSPAAQSVAKRVAHFIRHESQLASNLLSHPRGNPISRDVETITRNESLNGIATTNGLAPLAGVSPGIRPLQTLLTSSSESTKLKVRPLLQKVALERGLWSQQVEGDLLRWNSLQPSPDASHVLKRLLLTEHEMPEEAITTIAQIWQKFLAAPVADALQEPRWEELFQDLASERNAEIKDLQEELTEPNLHIQSETADQGREILEDSEPLEKKWQPVSARTRGDLLNSRTYQVSSPVGPLKVTIGSDEIGPYEISLQVGKAGSDMSAQAEALSRLSTLLLSHNVAPELIVNELRDICSPWANALTNQEENWPLSLADGLAQILAKELKLEKEVYWEQEEISEEENTVVERKLEIPEEVTEITERYEGGAIHLH